MFLDYISGAMYAWEKYTQMVAGIQWLTHVPLVPHIRVIESGLHSLRQWLVAYSAPSHYLNQRWFIVNWVLRNTFQWTSNQFTKLFIHEIISENLICDMTVKFCPGADELTHVPWTKWSPFRRRYFHMHFWWIKVWRLFLRVQLIIIRIGNKPLSETVLTLFTDWCGTWGRSINVTGNSLH